MADDPALERPEDDVEMTFFEHLAELRKRLLWSLAAFVPAFAVSWWFREELLMTLQAPLLEALRIYQPDAPPDIKYTSITEPVVAYLQVCAIAGLVLAAPWVSYQLWLFVSPGLYKREKRFVIPFILASTLFFAGGVAFCYFIVLGPAFQTLMEFAGPSMSPMLTVKEYLTTAVRFLLAFGVTFEVPVVITFLALTGVVTWRQLITWSRWWLLASAIVAALLTPPDVVSQMMVFVPLNVLYWLSIVAAFFFGPKRVKPGELTEDGYER
ncbi:MAG: twin-arginine translocase subunit TatC [Sandaracinaceae bacterium]